MAKLYGSVQGERTPAHRTATKRIYAVLEDGNYALETELTKQEDGSTNSKIVLRNLTTGDAEILVERTLTDETN